MRLCILYVCVCVTASSHIIADVPDEHNSSDVTSGILLRMAEKV